MARDGVPMPAGAMLVDKKSRRTLLTSWMQPTDMEPDYGREVDFVER